MLNKKIILALVVGLVFLGCNSSISDVSKIEIQSNKDFFFPTQQSKSIVMRQARLSGVLKNKQNCLRINDSLIIWPNGFFFKDNSIYDENNHFIVKIGESIVLSGGGFSSIENSKKTMKTISEHINLINMKCDDPYFIVDSIM
jgi:hypothetical protein